MVNITATLSTLITANHILHHLSVLDAMGHISVRNPSNHATFFIAKQMGPAVVSGPDDIGEYYVEDGSPVSGIGGGYAERYIHSEIMKRYPDVMSVVHSHSEDVLPFTVLEGVGLESVYHMAGFLGKWLWDFLRFQVSAAMTFHNWKRTGRWWTNGLQAPKFRTSTSKPHMNPLMPETC
jgi:ribulose-5-phosphate 4-epimerase/fuculose-1-phosphate aldolase